MVDFVLNIRSEFRTREIFANLIQIRLPVIPDNQLAKGDSIQNHPGSEGDTPVGGVGVEVVINISP